MSATVDILPASAVGPLALTAPDVVPLSRNPAAVYLASLPSPTSRATMATAVRVLARAVGGPAATMESIPWHALRAEHALWIRARVIEKEYAPATARRYLSALRGILTASWELRYLDGEELRRATHWKAPTGSRLPPGRALAADEVRTLLDACDDTARGRRRRASLALLFAGGLRRCEAVRASVEKLDRRRRAVSVIGKGDRERFVPLGAAWSLLGPWLELRGDAPGPILRALHRAPGRPVGVPTARPLSETALYEDLRELGKACGVAFSPHDGRRTRITELYEHGADLDACQRLAGHRNPATTARYLRRDESIVERAVAAAGFLGDKG